MYSCNNITSKCMRQKLILLQGGMNKTTTLVGDFYTALLVIDKQEEN